jgi:hypothetical protein
MHYFVLEVRKLITQRRVIKSQKNRVINKVLLPTDI